VIVNCAAAEFQQSTGHRPGSGIGTVRYKAHARGIRNLKANIGTKLDQFKNEKEVRAMLWILSPHGPGNRHIDPENRYRDRPIYPTTNEKGIWWPIDVRPRILCRRSPIRRLLLRRNARFAQQVTRYMSGNPN